MKYLLISDSHGLLTELGNLKAKYQDYEILHAGDFTIPSDYLDKLGIKYVAGNCDKEGAKELILKTSAGIIYMTHGDRYQVKFGLNRLYYRSLEVNATYVIFGHTHSPLILKEGDITFLNPGSLKDTKTYILLEDGKASIGHL